MRAAVSAAGARAARSGRPRGDAGQTLVLTLGMALVATALVAVVVDASTVFLARRALAGAADGAAVAAASGAAEEAIYRGDLDSGTLPLDAAAVSARVERYAAQAGLAARFPGFAVAGTSTDGATVTVVLAARVGLPFTGLVAARWSGGVPLTATAAARSPVAPPPGP